MNPILSVYLYRTSVLYHKSMQSPWPSVQTMAEITQILGTRLRDSGKTHFWVKAFLKDEARLLATSDLCDQHDSEKRVQGAGMNPILSVYLYRTSVLYHKSMQSPWPSVQTMAEITQILGTRLRDSGKTHFWVKAFLKDEARLLATSDLCDQHDSEKRVQGTPSKSSRFFLGCFRKNLAVEDFFNRVFMYEGQGAADMAPE